MKTDTALCPHCNKEKDTVKFARLNREGYSDSCWDCVYEGMRADQVNRLPDIHPQYPWINDPYWGN